MYLPDLAAMEALAAQLGGATVQTGIVYLQGKLGTGKTTLVRGWLRALGVESPIRSPTYTLVEPYVTAKARVYHFDLYRLSDAEELEYLGARDYFLADVLCLIEWPERGKGWLPAADLLIQIAFAGSGRRVDITGHSAVGAQFLAALGKPQGSL